MTEKSKNPLGKGIGGQAVLEGVMMRGKTMYSLAVRKPDKTIAVEKTFFKSKPNFIMKLPLIRGVVSFVSSLVVGMKVTGRSAELAGLEDLEYDQDSKFERWLEKMGIMENGKLTKYAGDPTIFLQKGR